MFIQRQLCFSLLFVSLAWGAAAAQGQTATTAQRPGPEFNIIINRQSVRFASPTQAREWQIEIYNQTGELVFASGNLLSAELDWPLLDQSGKPVESGLYTYTLTLKDQTDGSRHVQRGHVIVDRASSADRVWVTSSQHAGVGADNEATKVTVVGSHESTVGGAELPATAPLREESASNREGDASSKDRTESLIQSTASISGSGITNRITKWTDGPNGVVGNSALTEVNGLVGLGTSTPNRQLTVQSNSAAYLNVKANSGTHELLLGADSNGGIVSTMTNHDLQLRAGGNSTKMTIKANGNVGIGTLSPANQLSVAGSADIAGLFGIGTTRPTLPLHIEGTMAPMRMVDKKPSGRNWVFGTGHNFDGDFVFLDATSNLNVWHVLPGFTDASGAFVNGAFVVDNRNVGIGTTNPQAKLDVAGTVRGNGGSGPGVVGQSSGGFAMRAEGNVQQSLDKGGWVKAIVNFHPAINGISPAFMRCFRGDENATGANANSCGGFSHSSTNTGNPTITYINFPFAVSGRFILVSVSTASEVNASAVYEVDGSNRIRVETWVNGDSVSTSGVRFTLVVF